MISTSISFALAMVICLVAPMAAEAYIGPGVGLTAIGTTVAFFVAILLAIVGFVFYPLKRLLKKLKGGSQDSKDESQQARP